MAAPSASPTTGGLHFSFQSEPVLFNSLRLHSWFSFLLALLLSSIICLFERYITFLLTIKSHHTNDSPSSSPLCAAMRRTGLYAVATVLRLAYMLVAMSMNIGLIAVIVLSLSLGQLYIEYHQECSSSSSSKGGLTASYTSIPLHQRMESDLESMWDGSREARDKARSIMMGSSTSGPLSSQVQHHFGHTQRDSLAGRPLSPIHRRQASTSSLRPLRGSGTSLQQGGRGSVTPTGTRKALFQIGSGDESQTSESD